MCTYICRWIIEPWCIQLVLRDYTHRLINQIYVNDLIDRFSIDRNEYLDFGISTSSHLTFFSVCFICAQIVSWGSLDFEPCNNFPLFVVRFPLILLLLYSSFHLLLLSMTEVISLEDIICFLRHTQIFLMILKCSSSIGCSSLFYPRLMYAISKTFAFFFKLFWRLHYSHQCIKFRSY